MPATVTGANDDGTFNVQDQSTGMTMPATPQELAPYPDLAAQADEHAKKRKPFGAELAAAIGAGASDVSGATSAPPPSMPPPSTPAVAPDLSYGAMTQSLVPAPATPPAGLNLDNLAAAPIFAAANLLTGGPDKLMAGLLSPPAPPPMVAAPPPMNVAETPGVPAPAAQPAESAPAAPAAAPQPAVPRGTVRAAPVVTEPAQPAAATPAAQPATTPGETQDDVIRRTLAEQAGISQRGSNAEREAMQSESSFQDQNRIAMQAEAQKYQQLRDQALAAHNLDPHKFFEDKGALGSILFGLAAGAQGFAGGFNGRPEAGAEYVDKSIKQNLEIQSQKAGALDKAAEAQGNLVQLGRQAGLDHRAAFMAALPLQREMVAQDLQNAANRIGPGGLSMTYLQTAQAMREKNAALAKTIQEGNLAGASAQKAAVETALAPAEAGARIGAERASSAASYGSAQSSIASAGKTKAETANIVPIGNAVQLARDAAMKGQPIPMNIRTLLPTEFQNQISADGYVVGAESAKPVNDITSSHYSYDAALKNFQGLVARKKAGENVSGQELKDAGEGVANSAKDYFGIKRGQGEDQKLVEVQPGLVEALKASAKDASPGALDRYLEAVKGARKVANVVTNGKLTPYTGHPKIPLPLDAMETGAPNLAGAVPSK